MHLALEHGERARQAHRVAQAVAGALAEGAAKRGQLVLLDGMDESGRERRRIEEYVTTDLVRQVKLVVTRRPNPMATRRGKHR